MEDEGVHHHRPEVPVEVTNHKMGTEVEDHLQDIHSMTDRQPEVAMRTEGMIEVDHMTVHHPQEGMIVMKEDRALQGDLLLNTLLSIGEGAEAPHPKGISVLHL